MGVWDYWNEVKHLPIPIYISVLLAACILIMVLGAIVCDIAIRVL